MNSLRDSRVVQAISAVALIASIIFATNWSMATNIFANVASSFKQNFDGNFEFSLNVEEAEEDVFYDVPFVSPSPHTQTPKTNSYTVTVVITQSQKYNNQNTDTYEYKYENDYAYPTYTYPTKTDAQKARDEEFQRKWDEMSKYNEQKNKEVQEAQKKFCEENPNLCNR